MNDQPLAGVRVMVTRPRHQSGGIAKALAQHGAEVVLFPTIDIRDTHDAPANLAIVRRLDRYDLLLFISRNAVDYGARLLEKTAGGAAGAPPAAAIGRGTAAYLRANDFNCVACPPRPDSDALLATDALRALPAGARALIFRGKGGKEVLAQKLRARGIEVDYAEVYERLRPSAEAPPGRAPDLILVTSRDSLENLCAMAAALDRRAWLDAQFVLGSAAMTAAPQAQALRHAPCIARSPLDDDMLRAALDWRAARDDDSPRAADMV